MRRGSACAGHVQNSQRPPIMPHDAAMVAIGWWALPALGGAATAIFVAGELFPCARHRSTQIMLRRSGPDLRLEVLDGRALATHAKTQETGCTT